MNGNPYFYHEITKRTVVGFGNLFNDIRIQKRDQSQNVINEMKVPLAYGPIQKFLARLTQMRELDQPVETTLPRLSFELTSWQYDGTRKEPPTQRFKTKEGETLKRVFLPVPYNLGFELNILSKLETDALQIVEQIIPYFQPSFNITLDLVDVIGEKRDVPIVLNSINFTDDYEGDFSTRKMIMYTMNFTAKTYFFGPISDNGDGLIRKVQVDYHLDTKKTAPREMRYTVTPDPYDVEPGDDFGFNEETVILLDSKVYSPTQNEDYTP